MTIDERLYNLEKELSRVKRRNASLLAGLALALLVGLGLANVIGPLAETRGLLAAPNMTPDGGIVRANEFVLEDIDGRVCASLGVTDSVPTLVLYNQQGKVGARVHSHGLILYNQRGEERASLAVNESETVLAMQDQNGQISALLGYLDDRSALALYDQKGRVRVDLEVQKAGPAMAVFGDDGGILWRAP